MHLLKLSGGLVAALVLSMPAWAAPRDATVRVGVKIPTNDPNGMLTFVPELQKLFAKAKDEAAVKLETPDAPADLAVVLIGKYSVSRTGGEGQTQFTFNGILAGRAMPHAQQLVGAGPSWSNALQNFAENAALLAEFNTAPILRGRKDWPDRGLEFRPLSVDERKQLKVKDGVALVMSVAPDGAAQAAGLRAADVITRLGDKKLKDAGELASALYEAESGSTLSLEIFRTGGRQTLSFVLP